jgi:hypothetical protein
MRFLPPVALLVLLLGAPPATAKTAVPGGPLAATLGYFIGSWSCMGGDLKAKPMAATVTWSYALRNTLVDEHIDVPPAGKTPGYRSGGYASYEPHQKRIISVMTDEYGGWAVTRTAGWVGNTLTFHDLANDDNMIETAVDTRAGASTFDHARYSKGKVIFKAHCVKI